MARPIRASACLIAPVGVYIRSRLVETLDKAPRDGSRNTGAILSTVIRSNWLGLLLGLALISGGTITQYFLITMTPYAIRTLHLPDSAAMLGTRDARDHRRPRGAGWRTSWPIAGAFAWS